MRTDLQNLQAFVDAVPEPLPGYEILEKADAIVAKVKEGALTAAAATAAVREKMGNEGRPLARLVELILKTQEGKRPDFAVEWRDWAHSADHFVLGRLAELAQPDYATLARLFHDDMDYGRRIALNWLIERAPAGPDVSLGDLLRPIKKGEDAREADCVLSPSAQEELVRRFLELTQPEVLAAAKLLRGTSVGEEERAKSIAAAQEKVTTGQIKQILSGAAGRHFDQYDDDSVAIDAFRMMSRVPPGLVSDFDDACVSFLIDGSKVTYQEIRPDHFKRCAQCDRSLPPHLAEAFLAVPQSVDAITKAFRHVAHLRDYSAADVFRKFVRETLETNKGFGPEKIFGDKVTLEELVALQQAGLLTNMNPAFLAKRLPYRSPENVRVSGEIGEPLNSALILRVGMYAGYAPAPDRLAEMMDHSWYRVGRVGSDLVEEELNEASKGGDAARLVGFLNAFHRKEGFSAHFRGMLDAIASKEWSAADMAALWPSAKFYVAAQRKGDVSKEIRATEKDLGLDRYSVNKDQGPYEVLVKALAGIRDAFVSNGPAALAKVEKLKDLKRLVASCCQRGRYGDEPSVDESHPLVAPLQARVAEVVRKKFAEASVRDLLKACVWDYPVDQQATARVAKEYAQERARLESQIAFARENGATDEQVRADFVEYFEGSAPGVVHRRPDAAWGLVAQAVAELLPGKLGDLTPDELWSNVTNADGAVHRILKEEIHVRLLAAPTPQDIARFATTFYGGFGSSASGDGSDLAALLGALHGACGQQGTDAFVAFLEKDRFHDWFWELLFERGWIMEEKLREKSRSGDRIVSAFRQKSTHRAASAVLDGILGGAAPSSKIGKTVVATEGEGEVF